jgi:hypothetical protein
MDPCQGRCRAGLLEVLNDCQSCAFVRMIRGPGYDCAWWFGGGPAYRGPQSRPRQLDSLTDPAVRQCFGYLRVPASWLPRDYQDTAWLSQSSQTQSRSQPNRVALLTGGLQSSACFWSARWRNLESITSPSVLKDDARLPIVDARQG